MQQGKRLLMSASALSLATFASLTAAPASAEQLSMLFQGDPFEVEAITGAVKRFEEAHAGVTVELIQTPHDSYNEKFGAMVSSGQLADVVQLDAPFLANYVWSGYLQPLTGLIEQDVLDDMTASNIAQGTYPVDGKLYAIGLNDSTVVLYASRSQLEGLGVRIPKGVDDAWTKEELEDVLQKLADSGVKWPIDLFRAYGTKTEWIPYAYEPALVSAGCDLINRESWTATGTLDSPECIAVAEEMASWVKKGWVVPQSAGTNQFYAEGRPAGLAWGGHWVYAEAHAAMGEDLVVLPLPKFGEHGASPNGTWIYALSSKSENPKLAGELVSFILKDDGFRKASRDHAGFPGLKTFAASSPLYAEGGPMVVAFEQASKTAVARPPHPAYPAITLAFQTAMTNILDGADAATELAKAAKAIDEDIADNDGYPPFNE